MKILLVNPQIPRNFYNREFYLPSGLMYIGAILRNNGEQVKLLDLKIFQCKNPEANDEDFDNKFIESVKEFKPELIGFGGLFSGNFKDVARMSRIVKKEFPKILTLMGGTHPSMYAKDILENCPSMDWLVLGEGEKTVVELVNMIKSGKNNFDKLDGFAFRKDGKIIIKPKMHFIEDLDELPFPAYELIKLEDYYEDTSKWHNPKGLKIKTEIPIISSRSCPNDCNFCAAHKIMGRGWRPRSAKNVVDEIEMLYRKYGQNHFSFMDDNLTLSKERIIDICNQIIERGLDIQFETHNGVSINTLDDEVIDALASAGLTRIALPIESGSDYIRNQIMGKKLSREKIFDVLKSLRKYNQIYARAFFIIGMPEETSETLMDTYNLIKDMDVEKIHLTNIIPFPGTRVFEQAARDNLLVDINLKEMYKSDQLYQTNYDKYFIKPYNLDVNDLRKFREKCDILINRLSFKRK